MKWAEGLSIVSWAPRFVKSGFDIVTGKPLRTGTGSFWKQTGTRAQATRQYLRGIASLTAIYGGAIAMGFDIETDMTSADFGNIHMGNHSWNPLASIKTTLIFLARTIRGYKKEGNKKTKLRERGVLSLDKRLQNSNVPYGEGWDRTFSRYLQSKAHPTVGTGMSFFTGRRYNGEELSLAGTLEDMFMPIAPSQTKEIIENESAEKATFYLILNYLGVNVQKDYSKNKKRN